MDERDNQLAGGGVFPENTERLERERNSPIDVIVMNPPYSVGQRSANDDNQNAKYALDERIRETYAAKSTATNKNGLYDSYYRALRWATDRIKERGGIIAFVSNSGFVDGNTADGVRLTWSDEFSDIFVFNLRGNQRTQGEVSRREGGKVFGSGSRTGVAIVILVKSPDHDGPARVHYADIGDYLSREEKLERLRTERSLRGTDYIELAPNEAGDWINQRDDRFWRFQPISGDGGIFATMSNGLKTNRDAWCFSFSRPRLESQMRRLIDNSNAVAMKTNTFDPEDPTQVNWNRALRRDAERGVTHDWDDKAIRLAAYRPFTREWVYFDRAMNDMIYRLPKLFPTTNHPNHAIVLPAGLSTAHFAPTDA